MLKKFVKKIGKGIKKIGKAIGKPFKKLMKTKLGKIVGTIGMMLIGGWMMSGAKAFTSTLWAGQGMGTAFSNGLGAMGNAANATFSTITDGIKGMFGETATAQKATAEKLSNEVAKNAGSSVDFASDAVVSGGQKADIIGDKLAGMPSPTDVTEQAVRTTTDGSIVTAGTETAGGRLIEETSRVGNISKPPTTSLLEPQGVDFAKLTPEQITPDLTLTDPKLPPLDPKQPGFIERNFPRVADILDESKTLTEVYDKSLGYAPLQDTNLPKFVRNTTIGEGMTVASLLASPPDPYVQGRSDTSGAISALSANEERLYGQMPMEQFASQTSLPSPSPTTALSLLNKYKQAGHIYDTTLLAS
tara:strand:+ start:2019 stop:3095 length:1077 start_codon:yes stop_codon:yes gene_type:complete